MVPDRKVGVLEGVGTRISRELALCVKLLVNPVTSVKEIIDQRPIFTATVIWVASWEVPWILVGWANLSLYRETVILASVVLPLVGLLSLVSLIVFSWVVDAIGAPRHWDFKPMYGVVGYSALPHLVATAILTIAQAEVFGAPDIARLSEREVLIAGGVMGLWQYAGIVTESISLFFIPPAVSLWSAVLGILGLHHIGASWFRASASYGIVVFFATIIWGILGVVLSFGLGILAHQVS